MNEVVLCLMKANKDDTRLISRGGVGMIGDLMRSQPLNCWSEIHLILWEVPEKFDKWRFWSTLPKTPRVRLTEVKWATTAEWQQICDSLTVLVGQWQGQEQPRKRKRLQFNWLNQELNT